MQSQASLTYENILSKNNSNILGGFNSKLAYQEKLTTLGPLHSDKNVDKFITKTNKLVLNSSLDLFKHPAYMLLDLLICHVFNNIAKLCCAIVNTSNGAHLFHSLAIVVIYNVAIYEKSNQ